MDSGSNLSLVFRGSCVIRVYPTRYLLRVCLVSGGGRGASTTTDFTAFAVFLLTPTCAKLRANPRASYTGLKVPLLQLLPLCPLGSLGPLYLATWLERMLHCTCCRVRDSLHLMAGGKSFRMHCNDFSHWFFQSRSWGWLRTGRRELRVVLCSSHPFWLSDAHRCMQSDYAYCSPRHSPRTTRSPVAYHRFTLRFAAPVCSLVLPVRVCLPGWLCMFTPGGLVITASMRVQCIYYTLLSPEYFACLPSSTFRFSLSNFKGLERMHLFIS